MAVDTHALQDRLTNLLTKPKQGPASNDFLGALESHVKVTSADQPTVDLDKRTVTIMINLTVTFREFGRQTVTTGRPITSSPVMSATRVIPMAGKNRRTDSMVSSGEITRCVPVRCFFAACRPVSGRTRPGS